MEALSPMHLLVILLIVLIFFGGRKIPDVMRGLGEGIREFREAVSSPKPSSSDKPAGENDAK
jgi:sec-independent protein translocase protein TatA